MSCRLYVKKIVLTLLVLSTLAVSLVVPSFAYREPLTDQYFILWGSVGNTYFPTRDNVYSITAYTRPDYAKPYGDLPYGYLISGTSFTNYDETLKSLLITFNSTDLNFDYGKPYTFEISLYQHPNYLNDELANVSFLFNNGSELIDVPVNSSVSSFGTLSCTFTPTAEITNIEIVIVGHIPRQSGYNRFHCLISPLHIYQSNSADMGGSFENDMAVLPDIDISDAISGFDGSQSDLLDALTDTWQFVGVPVQHFSTLFTFLWSQFTTYVPIVTYLALVSLCFGALAMILNIFGFAKSQGVENKARKDNVSHKKKGGEK